MKAVSLVSSVFTVGMWTLLSRILGFVRDILIAAWLGTGPVAEAFLVAFTLPNMFRRFFAEGAFNMAFVPLFSKKLEAGEGAERFARDAFAVLGLILIVFSILAVIFMPGLVILLASGFVEDERFEMTVTFGRVVFSYIFFISLAALLSGVLNAAGRFAAAAAAPLLLNVILIGALILGWLGVFGEFSLIDPAQGATYGSLLAVGVVIAGLAQLGFLWIAVRRAGFDLRPRRVTITPELKRLAVIAAPAALAGGVVQINLIVGRQVASFFDGAIAWLSYADRLYQLPLGVVGIAIGIVLLPELSRRLQAEDEAGGRRALSRAGEIALALAVPSAVALVVIPITLVEVLFQRGVFDADDTAATALAVAVYALGLPAFVMQKVVQPLYFAREDTKRPFYFAVAALIVNAGLAIGLAPFIGYIAAAIGTTVAGWAMLWLLMRYSDGMGEAARFDDRFRRRLWRILGASAAMGVALWLGQALLSPMFGAGAVKYLGLAILVALGMAVYFGAGVLMGAFAMSDFRRAVRRQR